MYNREMVIKPPTQVGNPLIRKRCKAVKLSDITNETTRKIIRDLIDSMRHHDLVGMAANQIGQNARIFVVEVRKSSHRKNDHAFKPEPLRVFINPKIVYTSEKTKLDWEGCGSVAEAGLFGKVRRPNSVTVEAWNDKGEKFSIEAKGLLARIIQHEMDHLNGVVFVDKCDSKTYMSRNEYLMMRKPKRSRRTK